MVLFGLCIDLSLELGSLALAAVSAVATLLHHRRCRRADAPPRGR